MDLEALRDMMGNLSKLSDDSLATPLSTTMAGFLNTNPQASAEDCKKFLHELRDWAVFIGGASSFVMMFLDIVVGEGRSYPPPMNGDTEKFEEWKELWTLKGGVE